MSGCGAIENGVVQLAYLECIFGRVVGVILALAGIVLFIMLVIGGFQYLTAGGDPKGIEQAKNTLTYAIAGIILTAGAYLILVLIKNFTGVDVTQFKIFQSGGFWGGVPRPGGRP